MKIRAAVALLLMAVAAIATTQITATIVPHQQTGFMSKAAARQDGEDKYCEVQFEFAVEANYPTTNIMDLAIDYSGTEACVGSPDSAELSVDIGAYFEEAGQNGYTVEKFTTDATIRADLTLDIKGDNTGAVDMQITGSFKEESVVKKDGKSCETSISVEYSLDYKVTVGSGGSQPVATGNGDVTKHSATIKCKDENGDPIDLDASWIDGILLYSGVTASHGFSLPSQLSFLSGFLSSGDVGGAIGSKVHESITTDLEALAEGSPSTSAVPSPIPTMPGATNEPTSIPSPATGSKTPSPIPGSESEIPTASASPASTAGATAPPAPTSTTGATSSPVPTSTTGATSSPVPTSTTGATSSPVPTSTTGATSSPAPTSAPVCVENAYIDLHGLERVHEQDSYSEVFCIAGSALPCGTADHLLDIRGVYVSYRTYCQSHTCTQKMAYVNGIKHSQASRLVHDGELKLTTMTDRTGTFGLYMTGLLQRNGVLLNVLDRFQRHEYI